ncbi:MAG: nuclear transport factor 2 family protein [Terrimonas sp.]|nr:nuclear transport factor 2 family protein [Terrimonas sp.]
MNENEALMSKFYTAFQQKDYHTLQQCYHDEAVFSDPVFGLLNAKQVRAMWEMLIKSGKDLLIEFEDPQSPDEYGTCEWTAVYTFSATKRRVVNRVRAYMKFADGRIIEHSDAFNLYSWTKQAFGWKGLVFGWSGFMQHRIHKNAVKKLQAFMQRNN